MDLRESLTLSAKAGEILTIIYHGGSQPGTKRQIVPIEIKRDALFALDLSTNKRKQFSINKIEIISHNDTGKAAYVPVRKPRIPKIDSLEHAYKTYKEAIEKLGWEITVDEYKIFVQKYFEDEKGNDWAEAELSYIVQNVKPWRVDSDWVDEPRIFKHLSNAVHFFVEHIRDLKSRKGLYYNEP